MKRDDGVRKFEYRLCRITASFDLEFVAQGKTLNGLCEDVSHDGIRVILDGPVVVGSFGLISFRHPMGTLELEAQVTHINGIHVGIVFIYQTSWEREMIDNLMASLKNNAADALVVPAD